MTHSLVFGQLEDAEFTSAAAVKAKKAMEIEVQELQQQLEEVSRAKQEVSQMCHVVTGQWAAVQMYVILLLEMCHMLLLDNDNDCMSWRGNCVIVSCVDNKTSVK